MDNYEILEGQMNIYEVIKNFEKEEKEFDTKNDIPVAIKTEEFIKIRKGKYVTE